MVAFIPILLSALMFGTNAPSSVRYGGQDVATVRYGANVVWTRNSDVTAGLVAWWKFDGNATDSIGTNHGTVYSASLTTGRNGTADTAYYFGGTNQYIGASDSVCPTNNAARTISAWVKIASAPSADKGVVCYGKAGTAFQACVLYAQGTSGKAGFSNWQDAGALSTGSVCNATWKMVTTTVSPTNTMRIYVNGVIGATVTQVINTVSEAGALSIGQFGNGQNGFVAGSIDDVRVYNRALSAAEILQIWNATK
jgi:hypothetical protein